MIPEQFAPLDAGLLALSSPWSAPVRVLEQTTSTNDDLLREGEAGAPSGSLLFAEHQTAGRGQFHRPWSSAQGLGLWFSLLLRLPINDSTVPSLSAFAAVALVETIRKLGVQDCGIKAPNDVLIQGRKAAGILVETRTGHNSFAVVGIGLNINHVSEDFPEELRSCACSLAMILGAPLKRHEVAVRLMENLGVREKLIMADPELLLCSWNEMLLKDFTA